MVTAFIPSSITEKNVRFYLFEDADNRTILNKRMLQITVSYDRIKT